MTFKRGKILLTEALPFDHVNAFLISFGYSWKGLGPDEKAEQCTCLFLHEDGSIKYGHMNRESHDWKTHGGPALTISCGLLVPDDWHRGDPGKAPVTYIFKDIPPTKEECPDGYLISSCGNLYQSSAALFIGCVGIVLEPGSTGYVEYSEKAVSTVSIRRAMFKAGLYLQDDYDLTTEKGLTDLFTCFARTIGSDLHDFKSRFFSGMIDKRTPWCADTFRIEGCYDWEDYYKRVVEWNSLPIHECIAKHEEFIKENFELEFQDKMRTMDDVIAVYNLMRNRDIFDKNEMYSTFLIDKGKWILTS